MKPNQITRRSFPEVFAENYFSSQILSDGKSNSHTRKITVVTATPFPIHRLLLSSLHCFAGHDVVLRRKHVQRWKRISITNVLFLFHLPRKKKLKSKPMSPTQPAISWVPFTEDQYHRVTNSMTSTDRQNWVLLLPLPNSGINASVSSLGKLSCYLLHSIVMTCKI